MSPIFEKVTPLCKPHRRQTRLRSRAGCCNAPVKAQIQHGDVRLLEQHAEQWLELCKESLSDAPFFHPEWIAAYLRAFEPRSTVLLATAYSGNRLQAVLPLVEKRTFFCGIPVKMLRGAGNEHSCRFDLVRAAGEDGDLAVQAIWDLLKSRSDWDLIELPYVPEEGAAEQLLRVAGDDGFLAGRYESYRSPLIPLLDSDRVDLIPVNTHFRNNLQRRIRKARENWDVRLRRIETDDPAELGRFYTLENSGWKGKNKTAIACSESTRQFYDEIARVGSRLGYFSLYLLEFDGSVVAGHFGLTYQGRYYSPKVAYDEGFANYGPGHMIVEAILRDILPQGFREFDFLGPWMRWKGEWARDGCAHASCYIFRPGIIGNHLHFVKMKLLKLLRPIIRRARGAEEEPKQKSRAGLAAAGGGFMKGHRKCRWQ